MKKPAFNSKLGKLYDELYKIKIKSEDTIQSIYDRFFEFMKKYGIKQGTLNERGNVEWLMCWHILSGRIESDLNILMLMMKIPKELEVYE
jgi:hypothetical protein